jgi:hypothetical protein
VQGVPQGGDSPVRRVIFQLVGALTVVVVLFSVIAARAAPDSLRPVHPHHWRGGVPVGFTLSVLQHKELSEGTVIMADDELAQARRYGANTIRLQITQDEMVGQGGHKFNAEYMDVVEQTVDNGLSMGLRMVINPNTEWSPGYHHNERMPTHATHVFWRDVMNVFANRPGVIFDLFNEPGTKMQGGRLWTWQEWDAHFQPLVTFINRHADNQIWLEGIHFASELQGMPHINGKHLVWTYHHLGAPWAGESTNNPLGWDSKFGFMADEGHPVVDAEYINVKGYYHLPHKLVVEYLRYARARNIGLLTFGLDQYKLVQWYLEDK